MYRVMISLLLCLSLHGMEQEKTTDEIDPLFVQIEMLKQDNTLFEHLYILPKEKEKEEEFEKGLKRLSELYEENDSPMPLFSDGDINKLTKFARKALENKKERVRAVIGSADQFETHESLAKQRGNKPRDAYISRMIYFAPHIYYWVQDWEGTHALYRQMYKDNIPRKVRSAAQVWREQREMGAYSVGQVHLNAKETIFCYVSQTMLEAYGNEIGMFKKSDYEIVTKEEKKEVQETVPIDDQKSKALQKSLLESEPLSRQEAERVYKGLQAMRLITNYKQQLVINAIKQNKSTTPEGINKIIELQKMDDLLYEHGIKVKKSLDTEHFPPS